LLLIGLEDGWLAAHCVMWCTWRECKSYNFEDCERTVVTLKDKLFKMLYGWMAAINISRFGNFVEFLDVFLSLSLSECFSCIFLVYFGYAFLRFNKFDLLIKKIL
jgi:hypothetical protein